MAAVSRRILALQQLLGGGGVDVVWMLVREPRLLSADFRRWGCRELPVAQGQTLCSRPVQNGPSSKILAAIVAHTSNLPHPHPPTSPSARSIMQRLFDMKLAEGSEGLAVVGLVEQQPALLLQPDGASGGVTSDESAAERLQAWQHGLVSDNASEWARRYSQLQQYRQRCGLGCMHGVLSCWGWCCASGNTLSLTTPRWKLSAAAAAAAGSHLLHPPLRLFLLPPLLLCNCLPACRHGDGHVGCRDTDDAELTRWATKQRSEHRSGQLTEEKREQLRVGGWVGRRAGGCVRACWWVRACLLTGLVLQLPHRVPLLRWLTRNAGSGV